MYVTLKELADYLDLPYVYIEQQVNKGNIKAMNDGNQLLVNQEHFAWHKEQIEKKKKQLLTDEEPLPEDWDAKDED